MYCKIFAMKKQILIGLIILFLQAGLLAQSSDVITEILDSTKAATFGQVCYLSAVHQNLIDEQASYEDALNALYDKGQLIKRTEKDQPITFVDTVYIFSKIWEIHGGLMYRLSKGSSRYAFKQFQADGIISKTTDPSTVITGPEVLTLYTNALKKYGGFDMNNVSME